MKPGAKSPALSKCRASIAIKIFMPASQAALSLMPLQSTPTPLSQFLPLPSTQDFSSQAFVFTCYSSLTSQALAVLISQGKSRKTLPCVPWQSVAAVVHPGSQTGSDLRMPCEPWPVPRLAQHGLPGQMVSNGTHRLLVSLCLSPYGSCIRPGNKLEELEWLGN